MRDVIDASEAEGISEGKGDWIVRPLSVERLFFFDCETMAEYQKYQRQYFDIYVMLVMFSLSIIFYFGRCNVMHPFDDGLFFTFSLMSNTCSFVLYLVLISSFVVKYCCFNENSRLYHASMFVMNSPWLGDLFRDLISISGTLGVSFGLFGRVMNGACPENVSLWEAQRCNPMANSFALPQDHVIYLFFLPLLVQSVVNGMTYRGTFICWCVSTITVILAIIVVRGRLEVWMPLGSFMVIIVTYKYEKLARLTFAHNKNSSLAEIEKRKCVIEKQCAEHDLLLEKNKHLLEIISIKAQEECRLIEKEQEQMVAMIGNIAHDLKTPLQSFLMDLESLKADEGICRYLASDDGLNGPKSILQSLESTCCFMSMAINRSIDFAKASRNIALVPHMETFSLPDALSVAVGVIRHLKSSSEICVHPLPPSLCLNMITDRHWFTENILCLLSNAVKYSNGGKVTVTLTHVITPTPIVVTTPVLSQCFTVEEDDECTFSDHIIESLGRATDDESEVQSSCNSPNTFNLNFSSPYRSATSSGGRSPRDYGRPLTPTRKTSDITNSSILVQIEDAGIGISEAAREELFQPFKQVQRLAGGTGLGLYSLSNRISALKGTRGVKSRDDGKQGSVVWFTIPYRPDTQDGQQTSSNSSQLSTPRSPSRRRSAEGGGNHSCVTPTDTTPATTVCKRRLRFLVVDDSPSILKVLSRSLANKKYIVETADNGSAAVDRLIKGYNTQDFDVVLMDLQMPVMDGIEAVRRYREFEGAQMISSVNVIPLQSMPSTALSPPCTNPPPRNKLFIIGMSANSDEDTKQCALHAGMDTFIAKPFAMAALLFVLYDIADDYPSNTEHASNYVL